jgi:hypothetical protein
MKLPGKSEHICAICQQNADGIDHRECNKATFKDKLIAIGKLEKDCVMKNQWRIKWANLDGVKNEEI